MRATAIGGMMIPPERREGQMSMEEHRRYHADRALDELNRGLVARSVEAARAHLRLSSMHMEKVRSLSGSHDQPRPPLVMG
jgi:hypothetical protein